MSDDEGFAFKTKKSPKKEMNLFEKRNEKEEDEVDVAELRALEKKALESAMATEAPKGAMGDVEEKVEAHKSKSIAHEAPENWKTGKYGPYNTPNPLLLDIFHQLKSHYFEQALVDTNKKFAGQSMAKVIKHIGVWPEDVTSGKKASAEIAGIGKGTAEMIDYIIKHKMWKDKDEVDWYPQGNIDETTRRKLKDDGTVPESPKRAKDEDPLEEARKKPPQKRQKKKRESGDEEIEKPAKKKKAAPKKKKAVSEDE